MNARDTKQMDVWAEQRLWERLRLDLSVLALGRVGVSISALVGGDYAARDRLPPLPLA